jgi:hypothetical protein
VRSSCGWRAGCRIAPRAIATSARETIAALVADFLSIGGVVLHGSWGRMPMSSRARSGSAGSRKRT